MADEEKYTILTLTKSCFRIRLKSAHLGGFGQGVIVFADSVSEATEGLKQEVFEQKEKYYHEELLEDIRTKDDIKIDQIEYIYNTVINVKKRG